MRFLARFPFRRACSSSLFLYFLPCVPFVFEYHTKKSLFSFDKHTSGSNLTIVFTVASIISHHITKSSSPSYQPASCASASLSATPSAAASTTSTASTCARPQINMATPFKRGLSLSAIYVANTQIATRLNPAAVHLASQTRVTPAATRTVTPHVAIDDVFCLR